MRLVHAIIVSIVVLVGVAILWPFVESFREGMEGSSAAVLNVIMFAFPVAGIVAIFMLLSGRSR